MSPISAPARTSVSATKPSDLTRSNARWRVLASILLAMIALASISTAQAHTRSQSFSTWSWTSDQVTGRFTIDARRATLLYADTAVPRQALDLRLAEHLADTITLQQGDAACTPVGSPTPRPATEGWLAVDLRFRCPTALDDEPATLQIESLFRYAATHLHILQLESGESRSERVLTPEHATVQLGAGGQRIASHIADFVRLGASHVATGWDHIAFLAALLLLIRGWRARLWTVTGFTVGHSVTLALVVTGQLSPDSRAVEALIGFSVVYAALDAARSRDGLDMRAAGVWMMALVSLGLGTLLTGASALPLGVWLACVLLSLRLLPARGPHRVSGAAGPLIATAFGLIHGAGFAGALLELPGSPDTLWRMLLGFNLGVEIGQIAIVVVLAVIGVCLQALWHRLRPEAAQHWPATAALCGLAALGSHWFLLRAVGA